MDELTQSHIFQQWGGLTRELIVNDSGRGFEGWKFFKEPEVVPEPDPTIPLWGMIREREAEIKQQGEEMERLKKEVEEEKYRLALKEQETVEAAQKLVGVVAEFERIKKTHWQQNTRGMVDFAMALAERMILHKIKTDPEALVPHIVEAIGALKTKDPVEVHLSERDLEHLRQSPADSIKTLLLREDVKWVAGAGQKPGEIYIDTEKYRHDVSVMTLIDNMKEALFDYDNNRDTI